jgi:Na+/H+ antiporter
MELSAQDELVLAGLLAAVAGLLVLAAALRIPYPILLVLGGLGLGFAPGVPTLELPPELVLVAFLPPLLYSAAFFTSLRDLRANAKPISLLSIGLVVATTAAVAVVAHETIPGLPWSAAFVLGAVVSPTDPIAATAIARRLGAPPRVVTIVEGESLINDGTALVLYRVAVAAVLSGTFTLWEAGLRFVLTAAGGIAVGLAVGMIVAEVRRRLDNPPIEITISLMTGYFAYLPAEAIGVSGVLAAVTVGIYVGRLAPELTTVQQRLQGIAAWEILVFVANSLLFVLVGLQLPAILDELSGRSIETIALATVLVCATVILTRVFWVFPFMHLPHVLSRREQDSRPPWQKAALVSWMGMRGAVALAAALALPLETDAGAPFPERDLIVFITFCVILVTLVVQGLTLPALIRVLELPADGREEKEEIKARIFAADAALARLDALVDEDWVREETAERLRGLYGFRRGRFAARFDDTDEGAIERQSLDFQRLRRELLDAERAAVVGMRNEGRINDEVMRRIERDLDLEDARLEI